MLNEDSQETRALVTWLCLFKVKTASPLECNIPVTLRNEDGCLKREEMASGPVVMFPLWQLEVYIKKTN